MVFPHPDFQFYRMRLRGLFSRSQHLATLTTVTTSSLLLLAVAASLHSSYTLLDEPINSHDSIAPADENEKIDVGFMDKLSRKPYLQATTLGDDRLRQNQNETTSLLNDSTLRILAVDIDLSDSFRGGTCRIALDKVYPHGIARDKLVDVKLNSTLDQSSQQLSVEQKAWVTSLMECREHESSHYNKPPGVRVLNADTRALNPHALSKRPVTISSSNSVRSKLGRYASKELASRKQISRMGVEDASAAVAAEPGIEPSSQSSQSRFLSALSPIDRELVAPWNQCAWLEEVELRLSGRVPFGATLQPSNWWNRLIFGREYQAVHPDSGETWSSADIWKCLLLGGDAGRHISPDSNKPHAVIANGDALQAVPKALRLLQKTCAKHDIPLFVIQDPRAWRNTHTALKEVMKDVRRKVKERIIAKTLRESRITAARAFERGRIFGRIETEAKYVPQNMRQYRAQMTDNDNRTADEDSLSWRVMSSDELQEKLQERGVIQEKEQGVFTYSDAFKMIARRCIAQEHEPEEMIDVSKKGNEFI